MRLRDAGVARARRGVAARETLPELREALTRVCDASVEEGGALAQKERRIGHPERHLEDSARRCEDSARRWDNSERCLRAPAQGSRLRVESVRVRALWRDDGAGRDQTSGAGAGFAGSALFFAAVAGVPKTRSRAFGICRAGSERSSTRAWT